MIRAMGVKELFSAIFTLMFRHNTLWRNLKDKKGITDDEFSVLREYAVPVITLVQLAKFPLIGVPRPAMFFAIATFLIDIAVLYLMTGGAVYLLAQERSESFKARTLTVFCYSMTPVWLFELFYFTGTWSWFFAFLAISYTLFIGRNGLILLLDLDATVSARALSNTALFVVMVNTVAFLLISSLIRLFNF
jgi:hypothetical protein